MSMTGIGTKSQLALKLQYEQFKTERRRKGHMEKEAQAGRRFELKQQKRKKKHRGR
ncbi:MAG TPA: YjdF family protein [Candidatus Mediterraneibacter merdavium]|nr:YjdF family protein [Candidatus Mediterraneibacter merdavium]